MWSTLGMSGAWSFAPSAHARVMLELAAPDGCTSSLYYNDQRNFGALRICDSEDLLNDKIKSLGPSWLANGGLSLDDFMKVVAKQCKSKRNFGNIIYYSG